MARGRRSSTMAIVLRRRSEGPLTSLRRCRSLSCSSSAHPSSVVGSLIAQIIYGRAVSGRVRVAATGLAALVLAGAWVAVQGGHTVSVDRLGFRLLALPTRGWAADSASTAVEVAKAIL